MTATAPQGTVTFAFTDIEGSTELLKRLGDRYAVVVAGHRRILREEFGARGGVEMDTQGDACFFAFGSAREAVAGAVAAQRRLADEAWPDGVRLRVRMSLHTGEAVAGEEGYVGIDVVRAARICGAAHGGQVLLSAATAALVVSSLPAGVRERDLGEHDLKDIDRPERLYQLDVEGLQASFPPLRTKAGELPASFEERLEHRINAFVEEQLERSLAGLGSSPPGARTEPATKLTGLAAGGLLIALMGVLVLAAIVLLVVLLAKLAF